MLSVCRCKEIDDRYIYCVINTNNKRKTYFLNETDVHFVFNIDYLKVELVKVSVNSEEYDIAVENTLKGEWGFYIK